MDYDILQCTYTWRTMLSNGPDQVRGECRRVPRSWYSRHLFWVMLGQEQTFLSVPDRTHRVREEDSKSEA